MLSAVRSAWEGRRTRWETVIGVLADVRDQDIAAEARPTLVQPAEDGDSFAVRAILPATQAASQIRSLVRSLDPALVTDIKSMRERIADTNARRTFQTSILSGFAFVAVVLALVGLYGLMSFTVKQRTTEIGIRLAIGSPRTRILTLILSQGMRLTDLWFVDWPSCRARPHAPGQQLAIPESKPPIHSLSPSFS